MTKTPINASAASIDTPQGDQLAAMTPATTVRGNDDDLIAQQRRSEWEEAGNPSVPLAVVRRVRAGDSYLKAIRVHRGLTQEDLAKRVGIKREYLDEIETARKFPNGETRDKLAKALEIHALFLSAAAPTPNTAR